VISTKCRDLLWFCLFHQIVQYLLCINCNLCCDFSTKLILPTNRIASCCTAAPKFTHFSYFLTKQVLWRHSLISYLLLFTYAACSISVISWFFCAKCEMKKAVNVSCALVNPCYNINACTDKNVAFWCVNWCCDFTAILVIFANVCCDFCHFLPWFSIVPIHYCLQHSHYHLSLSWSCAVGNKLKDVLLLAKSRNSLWCEHTLRRNFLLLIEYGIIIRDQPNSRFHGRDIFREIGLLPWKTPNRPFPWNSVKFVIFREF